MAVKARMRINSIEDFGEQKTVKFSAVTGRSGEDDPNASWSKWTPSGQLSLSITNPDAYNQFEIGKVYELTFNEVV